MKHVLQNQFSWQTLAPDILLIVARETMTSESLYYDIYFVFIFSHVCRHWRRTLISSPSLWNKIFLPPKKSTTMFLDMLLSRSGANHPLEVEISVHVSRPRPNDISRGCNLMSAHGHRIRTLTIRTIPTVSSPFELQYFQINLKSTLDSILSTLFKNKSAPMLEFFTLNMFDVVLPKRFLEEAALAPNLQRLEARNVSMSYQFPILDRLTHLSLSDIWGFTSLQQLLNLLEGASKNLKVLILSNLLGFENSHTPPALADADDLTDYHRAPIQFSHLETMDLDIEPLALMAVLGHITVPSCISWKIDCRRTLNEAGISIAPFQSFLDHVQTGPYLLIGWLNDEHIYMEFAQDTSSPPNITLKAKLLEDSLPKEREFIVQRLGSLFMSLHLSEVYFCEIDCRNLTNREAYMWVYNNTFGSLFLPFVRLEKLIIRCGSRNNEVFKRFVAQLGQTSNSESAVTLPCPLLNELKFGVIYNHTSTSELTRVLKERKNAGHILKNIHVGVENYYEWYSYVKGNFEDFAENVAVYRVISKYSVFTRKFDNTY